MDKRHPAQGIFMKSTRSSLNPFLISDGDLADLVLEEMDAAVAICDNQMTIVLANPAAQHIYGGDPTGLGFDTAFKLTWFPADQTSPKTTAPPLTGPFSLRPVLDGQDVRGLCTLERQDGSQLDLMIKSAPYHGPSEQ